MLGVNRNACVHMIVAFLLFITITGVVLFAHHCEKMPDSCHMEAMSDDPCNFDQVVTILHEKRVQLTEKPSV